MTAKEWFSAQDLAEAGLPGLPSTKQGVLNLSKREGWERAHCDLQGALCRPRKARGGGVEFHLTLLPEAARAKLMSARRERAAPADRESAWQRWERLPESVKATARMRLEVLDRVDTLILGGLGKAAAVAEVVKQAVREARAAKVEPPFSTSTVYSWQALVSGVALEDRAAYLAPAYVGRTKTAELPQEAWDLYVGDYLRLSKPTHASCYQNLQVIAAQRGWTLPSAKTLQRRLDAEIPQSVQTYRRLGDQALSHAYPHLERDRSGISPMQIGNLDGHTWDITVAWPEGKPSRPVMLAVQDIASGKFLGWRFDRTLNHHLVRLTLGDVFREHGLLDTIIMDNGRENSAKPIAGGQVQNRWKAQEEEPKGLLAMLGIKAVFTTPYWGQAKPIERAFRDMAHTVAKLAAFDGAYTGHNTVSKPDNYGARAIPFAEFEAIVAREIAAHNARIGRRGAGMNGRSFDQVFAEGLARRPARQITAEQLRLCMLASKPVSMEKDSGTVRVEGGRYWSPELGAIKRQKVIVRYDPERLNLPVYVYTLDGRLLAEAARVVAGSFDSVSDGRDQRAAVRDYKRGVKLQDEAQVRLLARDIEAARAATAAPEPIAIPEGSNVVRLAPGVARTPEQLGKTARPSKTADIDKFNEDWGRGVMASISRAE